MARGGGHRRPRHNKPQNRTQHRQSPPAAAPVEHIQPAASKPCIADSDKACAAATRELADKLYAELSVLLQREYGKTSEQLQSLLATSSNDNDGKDSNIGRVPVFRDDTAATKPEVLCNQAEEAKEALEEENRRLREQLAERDAENQGLQQQLAAHREEIEAARRRAAHLDARVSHQAEADVDRPMTAPELRAAFRGLYKQYTLREAHFIAVEHSASLESQLWQEKCTRAETRELALLDDLKSLRRSLEESNAQQRSMQEANADLLRLLRGYGAETQRRLEQCRTLVRAVATEAPVLHAEYTEKMQSFDQELWAKARERVDMECKLRAAQAENHRLDEAWRELQA
ncbi:hypothetical protein GGI21_004971, partial [Coemansia aciculifera]